MWIWFFLPMIPVGILFVLLFEKARILWAILSMVFGILGLGLLVPWFFHWYFICAGLMFGRTRMAQLKEDEVSDRIMWLTISKDARET